MKATKEGLLGVLAAIEERSDLDLPSWQEAQARKVAGFIDQASRIAGILATEVPDPAGMPFSRVRLTVRHAGSDWNAAALAARLRSGTPPIWLMEQAAGDGHLFLELVALDAVEVQLILERLLALSAEAAVASKGSAATDPAAAGRAPASRAAG
jgi:seryl-tRNA(Sec) selenium transferase